MYINDVGFFLYTCFWPIPVIVNLVVYIYIFSLRIFMVFLDKVQKTCNAKLFNQAFKTLMINKQWYNSKPLNRPVSSYTTNKEVVTGGTTIATFIHKKGAKTALFVSPLIMWCFCLLLLVVWLSDYLKRSALDHKVISVHM